MTSLPHLAPEKRATPILPFANCELQLAIGRRLRVSQDAGSSVPAGHRLRAITRPAGSAGCHAHHWAWTDHADPYPEDCSPPQAGGRRQKSHVPPRNLTTSLRARCAPVRRRSLRCRSSTKPSALTTKPQAASRQAWPSYASASKSDIEIGSYPLADLGLRQPASRMRGDYSEIRAELVSILNALPSIDQPQNAMASDLCSQFTQLAVAGQQLPGSGFARARAKLSGNEAAVVSVDSPAQASPLRRPTLPHRARVWSG